MRRTAALDGPDPVDKYVGSRISEKRLGLGLTQSDLAQALGVTFQQVQKYEKGSNRISASKLWATAEYFDVGVAYFFSGLQPVGSGPDTASVPPIAQTKWTLEIARVSPQLSERQQRLVLGMVNALTESPGSG